MDFDNRVNINQDGTIDQDIGESARLIPGSTSSRSKSKRKKEKKDKKKKKKKDKNKNEVKLWESLDGSMKNKLAGAVNSSDDVN